MNPSSPEERARRIVRALIWTYFGLLIIEGALRKWVVPGLSNPLLVVRDPVALAIYFVSLRAGVFPRGPWFITLLVLGIMCAICTYLTLEPYLPMKQITLVCGYGVHANFFHLPVIFVMGKVMRLEDVKRFGWWTLILIVPMTFLMVAQFRASPDSLINSTAGGEGEMMQTAMGKVRTAGPFSFVIGVVLYFALATSFLMWAILKKGVYKNWLLLAAGAALLIGTVVSGSRSAVASCALVVAFIVPVFIYRREAVNRAAQILFAVVVVGFLVSRTAIFKEGANVMTTRFNEVAEQTNESVARGIVGRVWSQVTESAYIWTKSPWWGYGLGIGTNAGANILTGHSVFLLTEGEWPRIELESGRVLGVLYILWRVALVGYVFVLCIRALKQGNLLPIFLFAAGFPSMFNGQFGQPTILGFAVMTFGLTMAALNSPETDSAEPEELAPVRRVTRRSVFAEHLHDAAEGSHATTGSSDR